MKDVVLGSHAELPTKNAEPARDSHEARNYPTPAEFAAQVGRVLAVCLGLALLAHVIVAVTGIQ
jgi:hypothetical protein